MSDIKALTYQDITAALDAKFDFVTGKIGCTTPRRLWLEVPVERFREVLGYLMSDLGFDHLCTITGLDEKETLAVVYHITGAHGTVMNLRIRVPVEKPVIQSVCDIFPGAANYERELDDLLGFVVEGVPPGKRYPLPDDWPKDQKPLRKDWKKPAKEATT